MFSLRIVSVIAFFLVALPASAQDPDAIEALKRGLKAEEAGDFKEAIREYRQATALDPANALARGALATVLAKNGEFEDAINQARRAIALEPKEARMRAVLGEVLRKSGEFGQSLDAYRRAYDLNPNTSLTQFGYVDALLKVGQSDKARETLQDVLKRDEDNVLARLMLGELLFSNRQAAEAAKEFETVRKMNPDDEVVQERSKTRLEKCEAMVKLQASLPAILKGEEKPDKVEDLITLAETCSRALNRNFDAATLYKRAFEKDPKLADPPAPHEYNLACVYLLLAVGKGEGADKLTPEERAQYRAKALELLRESRQRWAKLEHDPKNESRDPLDSLRYWKYDPDLAPIREPAQLAELPQPEQLLWKKFWAEHEEIIEKLISEKK